jgi:hypothetical protein
VRRVVYVEPYPKSLVQDLCDDSIAIDEVGADDSKVHLNQFVGITPVRYLALFTLGTKRRKTGQGDTIAWAASGSKPSLPGGFLSPPQVQLEETFKAMSFLGLLISKGLIRKQD